MTLTQWHRAVSLVVADELLRSFGTDEGGVTDPRSMMDQGYLGYISYITKSMLATQEEAEAKGPYVDTEDFPNGWRITNEDLLEDEQIQQAIKDKGVYFKIYNVKVCPHLPLDAKEDHALWMKGTA